MVETGSDPRPAAALAKPQKSICGNYSKLPCQRIRKCIQDGLNAFIKGYLFIRGPRKSRYSLRDKHNHLSWYVLKKSHCYSPLRAHMTRNLNLNNFFLLTGFVL